MARPAARFSLSRKRFTRCFYGVGLACVLGAVGQTTYDFFMNVPYFRVAKIHVEGVSGQLMTELETLTEKAVEKNRNMLRLDSSELGAAIASHPRIRDLRLEKVYPNTLVVRASERTPSAIVVTDGFFLVDREGFVLEKLKANQLRDYKFPYVTGLSADEVQVGEKIHNARLLSAVDLARVLEERNPDLYARFSEIHLGSDPVSHLDNLYVTCRGRLKIHFGDKNPIEKLPALEFFVQTQQEQRIDPFTTMAYVDLRFNNQIVYMDRPTYYASAAGVLDKIQEPMESADNPNKNKNWNNDTEKKTEPEIHKKTMPQTTESDVASDPEPAIQKSAYIRQSTRPAVEPQHSYTQYRPPSVDRQTPERSQGNTFSKFAFWRRDKKSDAQENAPPAPNAKSRHAQ